MDKSEVIKKVKQYKLLLAQSFQLEGVYLFGSYAKGIYNNESDIDVAVLLSNVSDDYFAVTPLLWKLRRQVDDRIEPILIDISNDKSGFLEEIKRTGIEII